MSKRVSLPKKNPKAKRLENFLIVCVPTTDTSINNKQVQTAANPAAAPVTRE